jgi:acyl-CoA thioesterase I
MDAVATERFLRYTHLEKLYGYLPGRARALPAIFGVDDARYDELTAGFAARARQAAEALLVDDRVAAQVTALPFAAGQTAASRARDADPTAGLDVVRVGGNDVTRVGAERGKAQVGLDQSVANLRAMRAIAAARTGTTWVWLTPVPVDEERVAGFAPFRFGESSWCNADIEALAGAG